MNEIAAPIPSFLSTQRTRKNEKSNEPTTVADTFQGNFKPKYYCYYESSVGSNYIEQHLATRAKMCEGMKHISTSIPNPMLTIG